MNPARMPVTVLLNVRTLNATRTIAFVAICTPAYRQGLTTRSKGAKTGSTTFIRCLVHLPRSHTGRVRCLSSFGFFKPMLSATQACLLYGLEPASRQPCHGLCPLFRGNPVGTEPRMWPAPKQTLFVTLPLPQVACRTSKRVTGVGPNSSSEDEC